MKRWEDVVTPLVVALVLLVAAFAAMTGYVAYSGMHKFKLPDAFERAPRPDAAELGAVMDRGLSRALKACGTMVLVVGAALAMRRDSSANLLGSVVVVLTGVAMVSQHWAAGI